MKDLVQGWWSGLPGGALVFLALLAAGTAALVRAGLHPTVFALVSWPGTLAHELAHMGVAWVLGARPVSLSLLPKKLGDGSWQLGSVGFTNLTWWNGPWTALAPMLLAPLAVCLTTEWAYPTWNAGDVAGAAWRLGLAILFLQASVPSSTDLRVAAPGVLLLGILTFCWW